MNHVAIDLGSRESQICVRTSDGTIYREGKHPTKKVGALLKSMSSCRVVMETGAEAFHIADEAKAAGHEVRVVPASLVRALGVGDRGIKTDERDARNLSLASCRMDLPSVHIPTQLSRNLKSMCGSREALVECRLSGPMDPAFSEPFHPEFLPSHDGDQLPDLPFLCPAFVAGDFALGEVGLRRLRYDSPSMTRS